MTSSPLVGSIVASVNAIVKPPNQTSDSSVTLVTGAPLGAGDPPGVEPPPESTASRTVVDPSPRSVRKATPETVEPSTAGTATASSPVGPGSPVTSPQASRARLGSSRAIALGPASRSATDNGTDEVLEATRPSGPADGLVRGASSGPDAGHGPWTSDAAMVADCARAPAGSASAAASGRETRSAASARPDRTMDLRCPAAVGGSRHRVPRILRSAAAIGNRAGTEWRADGIMRAMRDRVRLDLDPGLVREASAELCTVGTRDTVEAALREVVARGRRRWLAQRDLSASDALLPDLGGHRAAAAPRPLRRGTRTVSSGTNLPSGPPRWKVLSGSGSCGSSRVGSATGCSPTTRTCASSMGSPPRHRAATLC